MNRSLLESSEILGCDQKDLPSLSDFPDMKEAFRADVVRTKEDCVLLIRTKLEILDDELRCLRKEAQGVEGEIQNLVDVFFRLQTEVDGNLTKISDYRAKKKRREAFGIHEQLDIMKKKGEIEKAKKQLSRIHIEFDSKISILKKVSPASELLKRPNVIKLSVLFQKSQQAKKE